MDYRRALLFGTTIPILNTILFAIIAVRLGGDAISGHASDGHYFLAFHGKNTEVSHAVFTYSRWHAISIAITWPIAIICAILSRKNPQRSATHN
jgi:hypothetical protein